MSELINKTCKPCEGGVAPLSESEAQTLLKNVEGWAIEPLSGASTDTALASEISRSFKFKNYYETIAFVNAVAWIANQEDHHPDMSVSYNRCLVRYSTHAIGGLSENDFICAAKINALLS